MSRAPHVRYSEEIAEEVCRLIAEGESVESISKMEGLPHQASIYRWLESKPEFLRKYNAAREIQADRLAHEILTISDDGRNDTYLDEDGKVRVDYDHIHRSKLRVDSRKWLAGKLAPKKYGDRQQIDVNDVTPKSAAELLARARAAAERLGMQIPVHLEALADDPDADADADQGSKVKAAE